MFSVFGVEPVVQHHRNVKEELERKGGGVGGVFIFWMKKFCQVQLPQQEAAWSQQGSGGGLH